MGRAITTTNTPSNKAKLKGPVKEVTKSNEKTGNTYNQNKLKVVSFNSKIKVFLTFIINLIKLLRRTYKTKKIKNQKKWTKLSPSHHHILLQIRFWNINFLVALLVIEVNLIEINIERRVSKDKTNTSYHPQRGKNKSINIQKDIPVIRPYEASPSTRDLSQMNERDR